MDESRESAESIRDELWDIAEELEDLVYYELKHGDCLDRMRELASCSIDAVVTDPPYGLGFMGKEWDNLPPGHEVFEECLRVLKPGGHLLAFGGSRTYHRLAVAVEDAGFEIRDQIQWVYGCLDEQTQMATPDGVKPYHKAKVGDTVLCYNPENAEYNYQPILEIVEYEYSDTAYRLIGDFGEQVVSGNHRCIAERGGEEVFVTAEEAARQQQARVPILESLPELRRALSDAQPDAGSSEQDVQQGVQGYNYREGEHRQDAAREARGPDGGLRSMRQPDMEAECVASEGKFSNMQSGVQRKAARTGMGTSRAQRTEKLEAGVRSGAEGQDGGRNEPSMEGRANVSEPKGRVCQSADQIRPLPAGTGEHVPQGRLCNGAPAQGSASSGPQTDEFGERSPHQSRCDGQQSGKSNAVQDERGTQGVRAWRGHKTALVRVEPFHYRGKVWCLRVPTGAFVAVRDGVAFPTGNSGFPKSQDVSKQIDKLDAKEEQMARRYRFTEWVRSTGLTTRQIDEATGTNMGWRYTTAASQPAIMTKEHLDAVRHLIGEVPEWVEREAEIRSVESRNSAAREVVGQGYRARRESTVQIAGCSDGEYDLTAPATDTAQKWDGWGTALKPAHEPIVMARKPLDGTVAQNVQKWGTGAINVDGCRIPVSGGSPSQQRRESAAKSGRMGRLGGSNAEAYGKWRSNDNTEEGLRYYLRDRPGEKLGRFPANLIHDGTNEATGGMGEAFRYFYCAKADKKDRTESGEVDNRHPTVKPTDLMRYLCRMVTPPGGTILDPFTGSGSTGKAAVLEGFWFVGIETNPESLHIAQARIAAANRQMGLF